MGLFIKEKSLKRELDLKRLNFSKVKILLKS